MRLLQKFVSQLDGLVVLMAAGHEEVFQVIRENQAGWFPESQNPHLPETVEAYKKALNHAAFLLGYAYFEAFLGDVMRAIYIKRPTMMPKEGNMLFSQIIEAGSMKKLINTMIDTEIRKVFAGSINDIQKYFKSRLQIDWPAGLNFEQASLTRNCLMHNGGIVDKKLSSSSQLLVGSQIHLGTDQVHRYGIEARSFAVSVLEQATTKHLRRNTKKRASTS